MRDVADMCRMRFFHSQLAIFIYYLIDMGKKDDSVTFLAGAPLDSPLIFNPSRRYEAWRYLTYMFIHAGYARPVWCYVLWHMLLVSGL